MRSCLACALALLLCATAAQAQTGEVRRVVLDDGTVVVGTVADETADPLVVVTENGVEQRIPRARVVEIGALYGGRFTRLDPNRTRLFLAPTGRTLGRGAGRFSTYTIIPSVAYGVTDRLDLSAGMAVPAASTDGFATAVNLNGKVQLVPLGADGGLALGANAVVPISSEAVAPGVAGTVYAVATLGSPTSAVTLGAVGFYGTDFEDFAVGEGAALLVGFEQQLSSSVKFITEDYLLVSESVGAVVTGGVRFFSDRLAADVAAVMVIGDGTFAVSPIPYVGFAYNFGQ